MMMRLTRFMIASLIDRRTLSTAYNWIVDQQEA